MAKKQLKSNKEYDLIIVGGGPAALSAGIYAARQKLNTLLITKEFGGQMTRTTVIENWLGIKSISGIDLLKKFEEHFRLYNLPVEGGEVSDISRKGKKFIVTSGNKKFVSKAVILTTGRISKKLNIPGESKFLGKGVSSCATCDAPLFSGKEVAVVGAGNTAINAAIHLSKYAKKIYIISKYGCLRGEKIRIDKIESLRKSGKVEVFCDSNAKEIMGDRLVSGIRFIYGGKEKLLNVGGVFIEVGMLPETDIVGFVKKNDKGEIIVNNRGETDIPGFFAAGDCTDLPHKQMIIAAGEGAKSALSASKYLESLED